MLRISNNVTIPGEEIEIHAIRSQGAGGQKVNKSSSAIHLRFDIQCSSLPEFYKQRLLQLRDQRINKEGVIIIKAQQYRSQEKNREDALRRLQELIQSVAITRKKRIATQKPRRAEEQRLEAKRHRSQTRQSRKKVNTEGF